MPNIDYFIVETQNSTFNMEQSISHIHHSIPPMTHFMKFIGSSMLWMHRFFLNIRPSLCWLHHWIKNLQGFMLAGSFQKAAGGLLGFAGEAAG